MSIAAIWLSGGVASAAVVVSDGTGCVEALGLDGVLDWLPEHVDVEVSSSVAQAGFGLDLRVDDGRGPATSKRILLERQDCPSDAVARVSGAIVELLRAQTAALELVEVSDPARCLDATAVAEGLVVAFGERDARRLDATVEIVEIESTLLLTIRAALGDRAWVDQEEIFGGDCPTASKLVVQSIWEGLHAETVPPGRARTAPAAFVGAGLGSAQARSGVAVLRGARDASVNPYFVGRLSIDEMGVGVVDRPHADSAVVSEVRPRAVWIAAQAGVGIRFEDLSRHALPRLQALAGPAIAFGLGYPESNAAALPAACGGVGVDVPLAGGWMVTVDAGVTPFRYRFREGPLRPVTSALVLAEVGLARFP